MKPSSLLRRIGLAGIVRGARTRFQVRKLINQLDHGNPLLVYQMGKVGSSTVVESLRHQRVYQPVLHIHTLDPGRLDAAKARIRETSAPWQGHHLVLSQGLLAWPGLRSRSLKVVTLVRDPVSRALSHVFETWRTRFPQAVSAEQISPADALREVSQLLTGEPGFRDPSRWFDRELKGVLGSDVFSQPFDYQKKFMIMSSGAVDVLVLRTEDLDSCMREALAVFLELPQEQIEVAPANRSDRKQYGAALDAVKAQLKLDPTTLGQVLDSRLVSHFYADRRSDLARRWSGQATREGIA